MPLSSKLTEPAGQTFDPDKIENLKPGTVDPFSEHFGFGQIRRRKPGLTIVRIAVLAFGKIRVQRCCGNPDQTAIPVQVSQDRGRPFRRAVA
jgi:hypothetical protein